MAKKKIVIERTKMKPLKKKRKISEETKEKYSLYKRIDELNQELSSIKNKSKEMSTESGPEYIQKHRT